jgi:urease accessory protein
MAWHAHLALEYRRDAATTRSRSRHHGPLRVLSSLYPEGPGICHHVLVHPPGGLVGGDVLELDLDLGTESHALLTTPGATRFYRSAGATARQQVRGRLAAGARLEWLPLEAICHRDTLAESRLVFDLAAGAEMIGWDVLALGLPASGEAYDRGCFDQHIELPGAWLERARIDGRDARLLDGPVGWAGRRVLATLWFAVGAPLGAARRETLLDAARAVVAESPLAGSAGCTAPGDRTVVLRALAPRVEPAMALLAATRAAWRAAAWALEAHPPRIWRT